MNKETILYLEEILHTGHHGPEGERKVGEKYDKRRNTYCRLIPENPQFGESVTILHYNDPEDWHSLPPVFCTFTTPFEYITEEDKYIVMRTLNSIYRFRKEAGNGA